MEFGNSNIWIFKIWDLGISEFWNNGILIIHTYGISEFRNFGMSRFGNLGNFICWTFGVSIFGNFEIREFKNGLGDFRNWE